jgi:hypothetical protein
VESIQSQGLYFAIIMAQSMRASGTWHVIAPNRPSGNRNYGQSIKVLTRDIETYYKDSAALPGSTCEPVIPYPELAGEELTVSGR